jgi:hypothetical protein
MDVRKVVETDAAGKFSFQFCSRVEEIEKRKREEIKFRNVFQGKEKRNTLIKLLTCNAHGHDRHHISMPSIDVFKQSCKLQFI